MVAAPAHAQPAGDSADTGPDAAAEPPASPDQAAAPNPGDSANPETRARARQLANEGMQLVNTGRVEEGLAKLKEAQELVPVPTIAVAIARALVSVGRHTEAIRTYRALIDMPLPSWLKGLARMKQEHVQRTTKEELAKLLKKVPKVRVVIVGEDATRVVIDGKERELASLQRQLFIDPGIHVFEAWAGEAVVRKEVNVRLGEAITVALRLEEAQAEEPPPAPPAPPPEPPPPPPPDTSSPLPITGYVLLGVAGLGLAATVGTWIAAADLAGDLEGSCPDDRCDEAALGPDGVDDLDTYGGLRTATIALGVVTGVVAAVGATLVIVAPSDEQDGAVSIHLSPWQVRIDARF